VQHDQVHIHTNLGILTRTTLVRGRWLRTRHRRNLRQRDSYAKENSE
jgi:hypothetical protein